MYYYYFYQAAMILSLVMSSFVVVLAWRRYRVPGAIAMGALAAATFIWTLGFYIEANSNTLEQQLFFNDIGYIGSMSVPVAWFIFALHYATDNRWLTGFKILPFCIIPLVTLALVWSNDWHHLMWYDTHLTASGHFTVTAKTYGSFFWVALAHNYVLIFAGAVILLRRMFVGVRLYTQQAISLVVAVGLPLIWNFIYVFNLVPLPRKDLTPVMFAISGVVVILGLMRFQLLEAVPFSRNYLIKQLSDGVLAFDMSRRLLEANPAALTMFGADKNIIGKRLEDLSPAMSSVLERLSAGESSSTELLLTISGEKRFYEVETVLMCNNHGQQLGWLAIIHDISERKRHELEYRTIIQTTSDGFWLMDMQGHFIEMNDAYCQLIGYSRDELLKMSISDIEAVEKPEQITVRIDQIVNGGKDRFETRHRHKDGRSIDVEVSVNYLDFGGGKLFVFVRDITERKKMHEQLIAQDRLVSIGEFTAGIAHELNNPLSNIIGFSELLRKRDFTADIQADLNIIGNEAERAARIIQHLLLFAREVPDEKTLVDVNNTIEKTLELRNYEQRRSNIQTITRYAPSLPEIMGNALQLQQVFLNIIVNAESFMSEAHGKGTLTIVTERAGDFVRISFSDNGPGIHEENLKRIFNPFFTTREVGKGTGLGLSICHGIVTEHGGRIWAESKYGEGATFVVELPISEVRP